MRQRRGSAIHRGRPHEKPSADRGPADSISDRNRKAGETLPALSETNRAGAGLSKTQRGRDTSELLASWLEQTILGEASMRTQIATTDGGLCPGCGTRCEKGEWITTGDDGVECHTGCKSWRGSGNVTKPDDYPQSGFLFSNSDQAVIEHAKEVLNVKTIGFDGTSALQVDTPRLALQMARVFKLMKDGKYRTLRQVADATGCLETSASARLRDLRKPKFGSHSVDARRAYCPGLVYEYKLTLNEERLSNEQRNAA
jgi:hypothetical protein